MKTKIIHSPLTDLSKLLKFISLLLELICCSELCSNFEFLDSVNNAHQLALLPTSSWSFRYLRFLYESSIFRIRVLRFPEFIFLLSFGSSQYISECVRFSSIKYIHVDLSLFKNPSMLVRYSSPPRNYESIWTVFVIQLLNQSGFYKRCKHLLKYAYFPSCISIET